MTKALNASRGDVSQAHVQALLAQRTKALEGGPAAAHVHDAHTLPLLALYPSATIGVTSEKFADRLAGYLAVQDAMPEGNAIIGGKVKRLPDEASKRGVLAGCPCVGRHLVSALST